MKGHRTPQSHEAAKEQGLGEARAPQPGMGTPELHQGALERPIAPGICRGQGRQQPAKQQRHRHHGHSGDRINRTPTPQLGHNTADAARQQNPAELAAKHNAEHATPLMLGRKRCEDRGQECWN